MSDYPEVTVLLENTNQLPLSFLQPNLLANAQNRAKYYNISELIGTAICFQDVN